MVLADETFSPDASDAKTQAQLNAKKSAMQHYETLLPIAQAHLAKLNETHYLNVLEKQNKENINKALIFDGVTEASQGPQASQALADHSTPASALTIWQTRYGEPLEAHIAGIYSLLQSVALEQEAGQESLYAAFFFIIPNPLVAIKPLQLPPHVQKLIEYTTQLWQTSVQFERTHTIHNHTQNAHALEAFRKMLLACAQDIRAVVIVLASLLQDLRWHTQQKRVANPNFVYQILHLYAPLANRLGLWQFKWELEDLAFRFLEPAAYRQIAMLLDERRVERQAFINDMTKTLKQAMQSSNIAADITGRPKHIYSIWKKMHGKNLSFSHLYDVRAFRIIVDEIKDCYTVLGVVHSLWTSIPKEFDDYISQPKPNGYRSLHTVVIADDGRAVEVQIRTKDMHKSAEFGLSAHWFYKEAGAKGYAGKQVANTTYDEKIAILRQLLEWRDESLSMEGSAQAQVMDAASSTSKTTWQDDHIYVFTPQAKVIALPIGATALDFAYHVHTDMGHRCRGAKVNGKMVPLNTPLENTQTVEITTIKSGGPSRDWLNPHTHYVISQRAKSKIRAWFNAMEIEETLQKGRALLEKILQREGKTAVSLELIANELAFKNMHQLLLALAKEEITQRDIEQLFQQKPHKFDKYDKDAKDHRDHKEDPKDAKISSDAEKALTGFKLKSKSKQHTSAQKSDILIFGISSLAHQVARCCKPVPGDLITGFITRGKGVSIHRHNCSMLVQLNNQYPNRLIESQWEDKAFSQAYLFDLWIKASEQKTLMHDINELIMRQKFKIVEIQTRSKAQQISIILSLETSLQNTAEPLASLTHLISNIAQVNGVHTVQRR